ERTMPSLKLAFASGETSLDVRHFSVREGISQLFEVSIVAVSHNAEIDLEPIVGKPASFEIVGGTVHLTTRQRLWKGVVSFMKLGQVETRSATGLSTYSLVIVPSLWLLDQRQGYRIFQHRSIPDIADKILKEWAIPHVWAIRRADYKKLEYKVQYGE